MIDRVIMRRLHDASTITKIVVSIGLLVALIQLATVIWPPDTVQASLPLFFQGHKIKIGDIQIPYHDLVVFAVAIVVAVGLRLLLFRTKIGVAMRAVVDNRELAALNGAEPRPGVSAQLGPRLDARRVGRCADRSDPRPRSGATHAAGRSTAYAAALVGRLRSLPLMVRRGDHPRVSPASSSAGKYAADLADLDHQLAERGHRSSDHAVHRACWSCARNRSH